MQDDRTPPAHHGVHLIDTRFQRPGLVATYLITSRGRAALVDVGVPATAETVLRGLGDHGVAPADVDYILVTHVHLDHAGATP